MPTKFHEPAIGVAVRVQQRSAEKPAAAPNSLVRDALFTLTHDAVNVHRAIGVLVDVSPAAHLACAVRISRPTPADYQAALKLIRSTIDPMD